MYFNRALEDNDNEENTLLLLLIRPQFLLTHRDDGPVVGFEVGLERGGLCHEADVLAVDLVADQVGEGNGGWFFGNGGVGHLL